MDRRTTAPTVARLIHDALADQAAFADVVVVGARLRLHIAGSHQIIEVALRDITPSSKEAAELQPGDIFEWCARPCEVVAVRDNPNHREGLLIDVVAVTPEGERDGEPVVGLHYDRDEVIKVLDLRARSGV